MEFVRQNWDIMTGLVIALFAIYKTLMHQANTKRDRRYKNIEILQSLSSSPPEFLAEAKDKLSEIECSEKLNLVFESNLNSRIFTACFKTNDAKEAIIIVVNKYRNLIEIIDEAIIPKKLMNPTKKLWAISFFIYILLATCLGVVGTIYPELFAKSGKPLEVYENIVIRVMYMALIVFVIKEFCNVCRAREFFKNIYISS